MSSHRTGRLRGFSYTGRHRYELTLSTSGERGCLRDAATVRRTRGVLLDAAAQTGFILCAYCFMPNRLHVLAEGATDASDFRRFVTLTKQRTGYRHRRLYAAKLWHVGYVDRILLPGETTRHAAQELLRISWREGLVADAREYPFLGSEVWSVDDVLAEG